jgi:hypothetical protein
MPEQGQELFPLEMKDANFRVSFCGQRMKMESNDFLIR